MQFSIRRPKLPSSETHPEENTYKRLDVTAWLGHLNDSGQVEEEYKLRKVRGCQPLPWSVCSFLRGKGPRQKMKQFASCCGRHWSSLYWETIMYGAWLEDSLGMQSSQLEAN